MTTPDGGTARRGLLRNPPIIFSLRACVDSNPRPGTHVQGNE